MAGDNAIGTSLAYVPDQDGLRTTVRLNLIVSRTVKTNATAHSFNAQHDVKFDRYRLRGQRFFEGRLQKITNIVILSPWNMWWQVYIFFYVIIIISLVLFNHS